MAKSNERSDDEKWYSKVLLERKRTESAVDAAKLLRFATTIDPYSLTPHAYNPWSDEPNYQTEIVSAWERAGIRPRYDLRTHEKLWQGISNTAGIIHNALDDYDKSITEGEAIVIVRHDISVNTFAHAAQLGEKALRDTSYKQQDYNAYMAGSDPFRYYSDDVRNPASSRRFIIDDRLGAIIQNPDFDESWEYRHPHAGCPFAHGGPERPKIFDSFVRWAGTLAVREYYENKAEHRSEEPN